VPLSGIKRAPREKLPREKLRRRAATGAGYVDGADRTAPRHDRLGRAFAARCADAPEDEAADGDVGPPGDEADDGDGVEAAFVRLSEMLGVRGRAAARAALAPGSRALRADGWLRRLARRVARTAPHFSSTAARLALVALAECCVAAPAAADALRGAEEDLGLQEALVDTVSTSGPAPEDGTDACALAALAAVSPDGPVGDALFSEENAPLAWTSFRGAMAADRPTGRACAAARAAALGTRRACARATCGMLGRADRPFARSLERSRDVGPWVSELVRSVAALAGERDAVEGAPPAAAAAGLQATSTKADAETVLS
jgi:hypothetical protein